MLNENSITQINFSFDRAPGPALLLLKVESEADIYRYSSSDSFPLKISL